MNHLIMLWTRLILSTSSSYLILLRFLISNTPPKIDEKKIEKPQIALLEYILG